MLSDLQIPFFAELAKAKSVLVAGAGGGFDVFSGLPPYFALRASGKPVHLANLAFSDLSAADGRRLTPALLEVTAQTRVTTRYFPEFHLARWFSEQGMEVSIHCFDRTGVVPLRAAYQVLVEALGVDTLVLVDGGTDSLMRGDEAGLGTPEEDMASIAAVADLNLPRKLLACLGFGVDSYHGVCHVHNFEAIAELTKSGGFLGAFSLLREMPAVERFIAATEAVFAGMAHHPSIVCASILSALDGHYGDYHATTRTEGSTLWINPLMAIYWCFQLDAVTRRVLYLNELKLTHTYQDLIDAINRFCGSRTRLRDKQHVPDDSIDRVCRR